MMSKVQTIYIINLEHQSTKRESLKNLIENEKLDIPFHFFKALYWKDPLFLTKLKEKGFDYYKKWEFPGHENHFYNRGVQAGETALMASMISVWEKSIAEGYETFLGLEDDCQWEPGYLKKELEKFEEFYKRNPEIDICYLGREKVNPFDQERFIEGEGNYVYPCFSWNTHAIIFTKRGVKKMLATSIKRNLIAADEFIPFCYGKTHRPDIQKDFPSCIIAAASLSQSPLQIKFAQSKQSLNTARGIVFQASIKEEEYHPPGSDIWSSPTMEELENGS